MRSEERNDMRFEFCTTFGENGLRFGAEKIGHAIENVPITVSSNRTLRSPFATCRTTHEVLSTSNAI
jgi:hypothetical protein